MEEYKRTHRNVVRFWNLIYMVAAAAAVTLVVCLAEIGLGHHIGAIVSGVSTVVGSSAVGVFVRLKDGAKSELEQAREAVRRDCLRVSERGGAAAIDERQIAELVDELTRFA